jgi:Tol biopolymer transport system component
MPLEQRVDGNQSQSATAVDTRREPLPPLVFSRAGGLWRTDAAGSIVEVAQINGGVGAGLALSPDGTWIAFVGVGAPKPGASSTRPATTLYVVRADGSEMRALWAPQQGVLGQVVWVPDGTWLLVGIDGLRVADAAIGGMRLQEIVRVNATTGEVLPLFEDALDPTISPDGTLLAYLRAADSAIDERAPIAGIEISTLDGMAARQVVDGTPFLSLRAPRFSPDGRQLVFAASGGPESGAPAGLPGWLEPPAALAHGQPWDLWVVDVDGSNLRRLAALREDEPQAAFSPDGRELAVMSAGGLYRMGADGSDVRRLDVGDHGGVIWAGPK